MTEAARFIAGGSLGPAAGTSTGHDGMSSVTHSAGAGAKSGGSGSSSNCNSTCNSNSRRTTGAPAAPAVGAASHTQACADTGTRAPTNSADYTGTNTGPAVTAIAAAAVAAAKTDSGDSTRARDGGDNAHNNIHASSSPTTPPLLNLHPRGRNHHHHHHPHPQHHASSINTDGRRPGESSKSHTYSETEQQQHQKQQQRPSGSSPPLSSAANPDPAPRKGPSAPTGLVQHNGQVAADGQKSGPVQRQLNSPATQEASSFSVAPSSAAYPTTSPADADRSAQRPSPTSEALLPFDADRSSSSSSSPLPSSPSPSSPSDRSSPRSNPAKAWHHWTPASSSRSSGAWDSSRPPPSLSAQRRRLVEATAAHGSHFPRASTAAEFAQGPRELILPKRLSQSSLSDDSPHSSPCRPPISYKPPVKSSSPRRGVSEPVRVPPIRAFRSSSSRRSYPFDNFRSHSYQKIQDMSDEPTLRALEGRDDDAVSTVAMSRSDAHHQSSSADDTGDVFLKIAREEMSRGHAGDAAQDKAQNSTYRSHYSHRRPLSTAVVGYHTTSPPRLNRRLSDHRDKARLGDVDDDQVTEVSRAPSYRFLSRDKAASSHPGEDGHTGRVRINTSNLRPSPMGSRSLQVAFQEASSDNSISGRRRASVTDGNRSPLTSGRSPAMRGSGAGAVHGKAYSSSPLVRESDSYNRSSPDQAHGIEGTESATSTTAPSTVWDELDDLKSRIHRLELTGKLPSSSGTTASRLSDERPATATTAGTTISLSPHRQGTRAAEAQSNGASQKEAHQILNSALIKSKPFISPEVYRALESAAHDAMGLSTMMGSPGQPGPISSGASTIGSGSNVTDRQLRRKADGVCRSLTELCVALGEEAAAQPRSAQTVQAAQPQCDGPATPTIPKSLSGLPIPRRASIAVETSLLPKSNSSPRALSRLEERRNSLLNGTALPTPRSNGFHNPSTPGEAGITRRSSLMVGRTRRAVGDETEDGRNTSLLRTRRTGPEEHEEGRRTSLLMRNRRGTVGDDGDDTRFRVPSRSNTDLNMTRHQGFDCSPETQNSPPDPVARSSSGLFGRRLLSSNLHSSRLAVPSGSGLAPPRRYLERTLPDQDASVSRPAEEYASRGPPLSNGISHLRASSLSVKRHSRDGMASTVSPASATSVYR